MRVILRSVVSVTLLAVLTAGVVLSAQGVAAQTAPADPTRKSTVIQKVIVKVNGEVYTQAELEREQIQVLRDRDNRNRSPQDLNDEALRSVLGEITPDILINAIDELLMVQRGRELGAKFSDEYFKNFLDNVKKQNNLDDAGLKAAMAQQQMTMEELRQQAERAFLAQHVQRTEIPVQMTEQEAKSYYEAHRDEFMKPAMVTVRQLSVAAGDGDASTQIALATLKTATDRAAKGEDFAAIVKDLSQSGDKDQGGLIADVDISVINPTFRAEIEKVKVGEITAPIKTETGYIIFKLEARTKPEPLSYEQVRDQIAQRIFEERMDVETRKHIEKLRAQALIEWKDDGYKQMYERAVAAKKTAAKTGTGIRP